MYSLNKLESYSRISALGPAGHCTSHFKRAVCISCRPRVDVHKGEGGPAHVDACGQVEGAHICYVCIHSSHTSVWSQQTLPPQSPYTAVQQTKVWNLSKVAFRSV